MNLRNLEQIQEGDGRSSRLATILLASTAAAALAVVGVTMSKRDAEPARSEKDPLADLVAEAQREQAKAPAKPANQLSGTDVTFPMVLSDSESPTTALVAVKDANGRLIEQTAAPTEPPPPTDRLPVVPLPAGTLLHATPVTTEPKDDLTRMAAAASEVKTDTLAEPGNAGGYQVQIASFQKKEDADRFVEELRARGHRAFTQAANVPGRGVWHRVRVGPFETSYRALLYKRKIEREERISALVIDPDKIERQEQVRAANLAARIKKYGRP